MRFLLFLLQKEGIVCGGRLHNKAVAILYHNPGLLQELIQSTSFLRYSASIKARLHCVMQIIESQPLCQTCDSVVKMRLTGRYRYTFPKYCSTKCSSSSTETKRNRSDTNLKKYGHSNFLASDAGKMKIREAKNE